MSKLTQVEQANVLEKVLASHNRQAILEAWVIQLLEALKQVADLTREKDITLKDIRAAALEIRYNLKEGPVDPQDWHENQEE